MMNKCARCPIWFEKKNGRKGGGGGREIVVVVLIARRRIKTRYVRCCGNIIDDIIYGRCT